MEGGDGAYNVLTAEEVFQELKVGWVVIIALPSLLMSSLPLPSQSRETPPSPWQSRETPSSFAPGEGRNFILQGDYSTGDILAHELPPKYHVKRIYWDLCSLNKSSTKNCQLLQELLKDRRESLILVISFVKNQIR